ncbi:cytochrome P450 [Nemania sp. FL0031]|nr:cytochrome P450 [Nemania sp. FL0031]
MAYVTIVLGLLPSIIILYHCVRVLSIRRPPNFPPCPPTLPVLGNLHQLSPESGYKKLAELCWRYSSRGLMGLQLGPSTHAVVINNLKVANDLIDQRGAIYSSRPLTHSTMTMPPPGDYHLALIEYGPKWRKERKTFMEFLKESELDSRTPIDEAESSQLMYELLVEPDRFREHILRYHGALLSAPIFGMRGKDFAHGSLMRRFFDLMGDWSLITTPNFIPPFDIFPFLKFVPDFVTPWRGWKQKVRSVGKIQHALYREFVTGPREALARGGNRECFMLDLLRKQEKEGYSDVDIDYIAGVFMEGGAETTASAFSTFILIMAAFPAILKKAQEEVDKVYGNNKMPMRTSDTELPYLRACMLEVLRWRPSIPTGIPHATTHDDVYEGFFIPANTMVILNVWGINHDPEEFDHPEIFDPTRFLRHPTGSKASLDQSTDSHSRRLVWTFGAGRRVCPGQYMAQRNLLLTMAKVVWCFDIEAVSPAGLDTSLKAFDDGMAMRPKPFRARFRVRGENRKQIIEREWEKADAYLKQFEYSCKSMSSN